MGGKVGHGGEISLDNGVAGLQKRLLPERFQALGEPLGWRCFGCGVVVRADDGDGSDQAAERDLARLAESAADHAMFCGRCDD